MSLAFFPTHCETGQVHLLREGTVECKRCGLNVLTFLPAVASSPKKRKPNRSRKRAWKLEKVRQVYERDGDSCAYCGLRLLPLVTLDAMKLPESAVLPANYPTLDHVVPLSKGGRWELDNLVVACPPCNEAKGDAVAQADDLQDSQRS